MNYRFIGISLALAIPLATSCRTDEPKARAVTSAPSTSVEKDAAPPAKPYGEPDLPENDEDEVEPSNAIHDNDGSRSAIERVMDDREEVVPDYDDDDREFEQINELEDEPDEDPDDAINE